MFIEFACKHLIARANKAYGTAFTHEDFQQDEDCACVEGHAMTPRPEGRPLPSRRPLAVMSPRTDFTTEPDVFVPFTTTMPARLKSMVDQRAVSLGLSRAAYIVSLARADLLTAGLEPPAPPRPKHNGSRSKGKPTTPVSRAK